MPNVATHERIEFGRLQTEWLKTIREDERPLDASVMGTSRDGRPLFMNVPQPLVDFLRAKGFEFDVKG